jgi:anti-sigma B factor antagonist
MHRQNALIAGGGERPYRSEAEFIGEAGLVAVSGNLDLYTAPQFRRDLDEAIVLAPGDLILDLSDLDLIDSTALCVMARARQRLQEEGRRFVLIVTRPHVMRILTITGLHTAFPIVASRRAALRRVVARAADLASVSPLRGQALRGGVV